jgi:hypothetical protein
MTGYGISHLIHGFISLPEIPGLMLSALLVDWFGRKATMCCLMFACCAFLGPLALHQNELFTTILLFGARACGTGGTIVLCLYAPEVRINFLWHRVIYYQIISFLCILR